MYRGYRLKYREGTGTDERQDQGQHAIWERIGFVDDRVTGVPLHSQILPRLLNTRQMFDEFRTLPMNFSRPTPRIAIIGAGPAGLLLAAILSKEFHIGLTPQRLENRGPVPEVEIYDKRNLAENDPLKSRFSQYGHVDLTERGARALLQHSPELLVKYRKLSMTQGRSRRLVVVDRFSEVIWEGSDGRGQYPIPFASRHGLEWLIESFIQPREAVAERCKVLRIEPVVDALAQIIPHNWILDYGFLCDKSHHHTRRAYFDMIIGAGGAENFVRWPLSDQIPSPSGCYCVSLRIIDPMRQHEELYELAREGSYFAFGDGKALMCERVSKTDIDVYIMLNNPTSKDGKSFNDEYDVLSKLDGDQLSHELITAYFYHWDSKLIEFIRAGFEDTAGLFPKIRAVGRQIIRPLYTSPNAFKWEHYPGLTLVGDAAHVVPPFDGLGIDQALADTADLAEELLTEYRRSVSDLNPYTPDWDNALKRYETRVFQRNKTMIEDRNQLMKFIFDSNAPQGFIRYMEFFKGRKLSDPMANTVSEVQAAVPREEVPVLPERELERMSHIRDLRGRSERGEDVREEEGSKAAEEDGEDEERKKKRRRKSAGK